MTKTLKPLAAALVTAFAATAAMADVTIGVSLPLTGPGSGLGIPMKNYFDLFPKEIAGEKINLIVVDDASDPTKGVVNAKRFVTEDKVDLIMGSALTPVAIAMAPVAAEGETAQLAFAPAGLPPGKDHWTFRFPQSNDVMAHAMVELTSPTTTTRSASDFKSTGSNSSMTRAVCSAWLPEPTPRWASGRGRRVEPASPNRRARMAASSLASSWVGTRTTLANRKNARPIDRKTSPREATLVTIGRGIGMMSPSMSRRRRKSSGVASTA